MQADTDNLTRSSKVLDASAGDRGRRSTTPSETTRSEGTAQANHDSSPAGTTAAGATTANAPRRRRGRRKGRSGPPSRSSLTVSVRIPTDLANACRSVAQGIPVGGGHRAWAPSDPNVTLSTIARGLLLSSMLETIEVRVADNAKLIEDGMVADGLSRQLFRQVPDCVVKLRKKAEIQRLRETWPALDWPAIEREHGADWPAIEREHAETKRSPEHLACVRALRDELLTDAGCRYEQAVQADGDETAGLRHLARAILAGRINLGQALRTLEGKSRLTVRRCAQRALLYSVIGHRQDLWEYVSVRKAETSWIVYNDRSPRRNPRGEGRTLPEAVNDLRVKLEVAAAEAAADSERRGVPVAAEGRGEEGRQ